MGIRAGLALLSIGLLAGTASAHLGIDEQIEQTTAQIAESPQNAALYLQRGELHRMHGEWDRAEADYASARKFDPAMEAIDLAWGTMLHDAGRYTQAVEPLRRFLQRRPKHVRAWVALGRSYAGLERFGDAVASFDRALAEHDPDSPPRPEYYLERARSQSRLGDAHVPKAIAGLDEGCKRLGYPITLDLLAIELELGAGRHEAAITRIDRIAAGLQRNETWLLRKGEILEQAGRDKEALEVYRSALAALDALPPARQRNRAVQRLRRQAEDALQRLAS